MQVVRVHAQLLPMRRAVSLDTQRVWVYYVAPKSKRMAAVTALSDATVASGAKIPILGKLGEKN